VLRLPNGVFAPYTPIPTNVLFFDSSASTGEVWFYDHRVPDARKTYTKTKPLEDAHLEAFSLWWSHRVENESAWSVPVAEIIEDGCNLDRNHPRRDNGLEKLEPSVIVKTLEDKETEIVRLLKELTVLAGVNPNDK
jgi:type I restriction enzyme M protein